MNTHTPAGADLPQGALTDGQRDYAAHAAWWEATNRDACFNLTTRNESAAAYAKGRADERAALAARPGATAAAGVPEGLWSRRWYGSPPCEGWSIMQGRTEIAVLGKNVPEKAVDAIIDAHNYEREKAHEGPLVGDQIPVDEFAEPQRQSGETVCIVSEGGAALAAQTEPAAAGVPPPIDMVLHCPVCGEQHIDAPEQADADIDVDGSVISSSAAWDNPPHRSHLCHGCGHIWRPADVPTNGVQAVKTVGKADSPLAAQTEPAAAGVPVAAFRALLRAEIDAVIDVSGDVARQEAQIDEADHLLVKFNELFPEAP